MVDAETKGTAWRDLLILTLAFGALFFFVLGRAPLANPDEGRYAEIPREMVTTGDWVTPRLNGVAYFEKPPLVYWCVAICLKVFGPSEWAMRATPALFSVGGLLLTYAATRSLYGRRAGVVAAITLGTSIFYFALGRLLLLDMAVSVLMSATLFCFILGVREPPGRRRRWLFYGLYVSAAMATLAKGPMGFLVTGAVMFVWLLLFNQWKQLRPLYLPGGVLLFLAIVAPWHVLVAQRNPTWAHFYFVHEHWERFTTNVHNRDQPWWFFVPLVVAGLYPWIGFLPVAIRTRVGGWGRRHENADAWFFVVWAVFILLFFSASHSKLAPYVLPIFPALAVLLGAGLAHRLGENDLGRLRPGFIGFATACGLLAIAFVLAIIQPQLVKLDGAQAAILRPMAFAMAAILTAGGITTLLLAYVGDSSRRALGAMLVTTTLFLGSLAFATDKIQPAGTRELALFVKDNVPAGAPIYHYRDFFHDFTFYAERFVGTVEFHGDELELLNDPIALASGRFIDEETFRQRWLGRQRIYVVVRKEKLREISVDFARMLTISKKGNEGTRAADQPGGPVRPQPPVLSDRLCRSYLIRESGKFLLLSNRSS